MKFNLMFVHMRYLLVLGIVLMNFVSHGQSTEIYFTSTSKNQQILNDLNNIKFVEFVCKDSAAWGKYFHIDLVRFVKGVPDTISREQSTCEDIKLPVVLPSGDTAYYIHNPCKHSQYTGDVDSMTIVIAGKQEDTTLHLLIDKNHTKKKLDIDGQANYVLQKATNDNTRTIPFNTSTPIALYFGGYKMGIGTFYCLAKTVKAEEMYEAFHVDDYYVFYLTIKD